MKNEAKAINFRKKLRKLVKENGNTSDKIKKERRKKQNYNLRKQKLE